MKNQVQRQKNRIKAILEQRGGATIVFALVVFMIAAIASATIVSVALANLNRSAERRSYEQARLAVMSAAKYLESNELSASLNALQVGDVGKQWTVEVADTEAADPALKTTLTWESIEGNYVTALIKAGTGKYMATVRLAYDIPTAKWRISKITKG